MNINLQGDITEADAKSATAINHRIPGWSAGVQYAFFKAIFQNESIKDVLILGVYHGRDIAYMLDVLNRYYPQKEIRITGVDRFTADPCADWPQVNRVVTWEEEVGVAPPSFERAVENTRDPRVTIIKSDDYAFLENATGKYDLIYLDTAHDFATVMRQLRQVPRICKDTTILCGDDYSDGYTWGVKSAVTQAFGDRHGVFGGWIWVANAKDAAV